MEAREQDSCRMEKRNVAASGKAQQCDACRHKDTERAAELQSDIQKRLNRAIGQVNGVKSMIDENRYCGDVLVQLAAAESALHKVSEIVLKNHLETCHRLTGIRFGSCIRKRLGRY